MLIETLIDTIKTDRTNGSGTIAPEIMNAVTGLVSRLEGMLPDVATARGVAEKLSIPWSSNPSGAVLAWAWTVWPLYQAGRIGELFPVVAPLLPSGQPFGVSEIDTVHGEVLLAEHNGNKGAAAAARKNGRAMLDHNASAKGSRGYTLVETLVTVAIIAVVAVLVWGAAGPSDDHAQERRAAEAFGLTNVSVGESHTWGELYGCGDEESVVEVTGTTRTEARITVSVCCGWLVKGCTVRTK